MAVCLVPVESSPNQIYQLFQSRKLGAHFTYWMRHVHDPRTFLVTPNFSKTFETGEDKPFHFKRSTSFLHIFTHHAFYQISTHIILNNHETFKLEIVKHCVA
jgi:hypothetical protein